ncbi:MAG TPA: hypothetical protein PK289_09480 [Bacteroidia bacterium]|nr:hypothetical protein [Bacteroidia bacterium]
MGALKDQDPALGSPENKPPKKRPGNPNFQKGKKNYIYDKSKESTNNSTNTKMADETTTNDQNTGPVNNPDGKKDIPNDIFSDEIPKNQTGPLDGEVVKKDYGTINDGTKGPAANPQGPNDSTSTVPPPDPNAPPTPPSPASIQAAEEAQTQAKQAVAMALKGYDKLHAFGRWYGKMDQSKLASLHHAGKINLNETFPLGKDPVSASVFFEQYNKNIDETIIVTEDFKAAIEPPLVRLAIKYNIKMSDEMFVAGLLADDLIPKASMLIGLKQTCNLILDALHSSIKAKNESNTASAEKKQTEQKVADPTADNWKEAQEAEEVK